MWYKTFSGKYSINVSRRGIWYLYFKISLGSPYSNLRSSAKTICVKKCACQQCYFYYALAVPLYDWHIHCFLFKHTPTQYQHMLCCTTYNPNCSLPISHMAASAFLEILLGVRECCKNNRIFQSNKLAHALNIFSLFFCS